MIHRAVLLGVSVCLLSNSQGTHPRYVIGADLIEPSPSCPVFVGAVQTGSPAAIAGIKPGDQLLTIDGSTVEGLQEASKHLKSSTPDPVRLQLMRDQSPYTVTVQREDINAILARNGERMLNGGFIVGSDWSDREIQEVLDTNRALDTAKDVITIFPGHYPADKRLYYPGFEVFVWDKGNQVIVGGIENGPAKLAGVRWGDRILSVNGIDPRGKSSMELNSLFGSPRAGFMRLLVERAGIRKTFRFQLEQASSILAMNNWQTKDGKLIPMWVPSRFTSCFK